MHEHPMRDRRFRALVIGQAVNGIGSWCALIAIWGYAAERFDAAPWQVAILGLTWTVPGALLGPMAGVPTDRTDPRRVLIVADLAAAGFALSMAVSNTYWMLVVFSSLQGFAKSFAAPALAALAPRIVDDSQLARANALLNTSMQVSIAFGPVLGAAAIEASGAKGAFIVDAITYLVGVAVTVPLVLTAAPRAVRRGAWHEAVEGLRIVRARPAVVRLLATGTTVYLLWGSGVTLEPLFVRDVLHRSPATFAYLQTAFGIMLVVVGLLAARAGERAATSRVLAFGAIASGLSAMLYLGTSSLGIAFLGIAMWGAATPWVVTPMRTLLQRATPVETHGRVFAVDETLRSIAMAVATGTGGLAFAAFGARASGILYGSLPVLGGAVAILGLRAGVLRRRRVVEPGPGPQHTPREDAGRVAVLPDDLQSPVADELGAGRP